MPYSTQLVPLTAILAALGNRADSHGDRAEAASVVLVRGVRRDVRRFDRDPFAYDVQDVVTWVEGGRIPRTVRESQFQAPAGHAAHPQQRGIQGCLRPADEARRPRLPNRGRAIDLHAYVEGPSTSTTSFRRTGRCEHRIPAGIANSIVNKTAIDARTTRRIGGRRTERVTWLGSAEQIDPETLDDDPPFARHRPDRAARGRLRGLLHRALRTALQADRGRHRQAGEPIGRRVGEPVRERRAGRQARGRKRCGGSSRRARARSWSSSRPGGRTSAPATGPRDRVGGPQVSGRVHEQSRGDAAGRRRRRRTGPRDRGGLPCHGREAQHRRLGAPAG